MTPSELSQKLLRLHQRFRQAESHLIRTTTAFALLSFATTVTVSYVTAFHVNQGRIVDSKFPSPTALFRAQLTFCLPAIVFFTVLFALASSAMATLRQTTPSRAAPLWAGLAGIAVPLILLVANESHMRFGFPAATATSIITGLVIEILPKRRRQPEPAE